MAERSTEYRRLPGRGLRRTGPIAVTRTSCRLFVGADHLLCVDSSGYTEEYRRFYYSDIQAILVRRTERGKFWSVGLAIFSGIAALLALSLTGPWAVACWSVAGCSLVFLLINLVRGPTCLAHLRTAVHMEQLPSLNRLRTAIKVLATLRPLIEQAQGALLPEEMATRLAAPAEAAEATAAGAAKPETRPLTASAPQPPHSLGAQGRFHWILFSLLLLEAAESTVAIFVRHVALPLFGSLLAGALAICTILALVAQQGKALNRFVRGVTWAVLGFMGLNFVLGYVFFVTMSVKEPGIGNDQWRYLERVAQLSPFDSPWLLAVFVYSIVTSLALGLTGLVVLRKLKQAHSAPLPAGPAAPPVQDIPKPQPD